MHRTVAAHPFRGLAIFGALVALLATACGTEPSAENPSQPEDPPPASSDTAVPTPARVAAAGGDLLRSQQPRQTTPDVAAPDLAELVAGNSAFAFDLYQALRETDGNLFYSPHSISLALAMTYAGARDDTARQMADTLHFTLPDERLHPAFNALDLSLTTRGAAAAGEAETDEPTEFQLHIANAIWGQQGYTFLPAFLDTLAQYYGAGLRLLDFQGAPDDARVTINDWVSEQTEGKITDLIPPGAIDTLTRLVLTNAIYFNAAWVLPFEEEATQDDTFTLLDGSEVTVPMMAQTEQFLYAEGAGYQAVELPYNNNVAMTIVLPEAGQFAPFEESLDAEQAQAILDALAPADVVLKMPRFDIEAARFSLKEVLTALGMPDAFVPQVADFSGMDGTRELFISDVVHQAAITVDEQGTEAAAATAVIVGVTSAEPEPPEFVEMTIDRPFIFLIRDTETGAILFVGRVLNPAG